MLRHPAGTPAVINLGAGSYTATTTIVIGAGVSASSVEIRGDRDVRPEIFPPLINPQAPVLRIEAGAPPVQFMDMGIRGTIEVPH